MIKIYPVMNPFKLIYKFIGRIDYQGTISDLLILKLISLKGSLVSIIFATVIMNP